jgi:hypothetical protein
MDAVSIAVATIEARARSVLSRIEDSSSWPWRSVGARYPKRLSENLLFFFGFSAIY